MTQPINPEFLIEAHEIVDHFNSGLIGAEAEFREGEVPPGRINDLFRHAHSIKGIAAMFGREQLSSLAHVTESVLDGMRLGRITFDSNAFDCLFAGAEIMARMLVLASEHRELSASEFEPTIVGLTALAQKKPTGNRVTDLEASGLSGDILKVLTEYEEHRLYDNISKGRGLYMLEAVFDLETFDVILAELDHAIQPLGELITKLPSTGNANPESICFDILVGSNRPLGEIEAAIPEGHVRVRMVREPVRQGNTPITGVKSSSLAISVEAHPLAPKDSSLLSPDAASVAKTVRVDIRRLDRLMNLVGELTLLRLAYEDLVVTRVQDSGAHQLGIEIHKLNRNLERRLGELQAGIMQVRMVPMLTLFERMVRSTRGIAKELSREVRIELTGQTTELDKLIVEELADPLMHIVRNAVDHGIEPADVRVANGKPPEGVLRLSAAALGNRVVVEISDDGAGIDPTHILAIAKNRGLLSSDVARDLSEKEIYEMIFLPGFSTKSDVSEYSGRGVGMDVVKTNIARLSGVIEVSSCVGLGTTFTLTLPITLAIIPALIVLVQGRRYAIPLNNVSETISLRTTDLKRIRRQEILTIRGNTIPVVALRKVFDITGERPEELFAIITGVGDKQMALVVDDILSHQDIVIKSMGRYLAQVPGIAGATELGDQSTILVIDPVELLDEIMSPKRSLRKIGA